MAKIRAEGGDALFVKTDVSKAADVEALIKATVAQYGYVDIAFNNAGVEGTWMPIITQSEDDWQRTIDINLKGVWLSLKYEIKQMLRQRRGGAIVNMASTMGLIGAAGAAAYTREQTRSHRAYEGCSARNSQKRHSDQCRLSGGY